MRASLVYVDTYYDAWNFSFDEIWDRFIISDLYNKDLIYTVYYDEDDEEYIIWQIVINNLNED